MARTNLNLKHLIATAASYFPGYAAAFAVGAIHVNGGRSVGREFGREDQHLGFLHSILELSQVRYGFDPDADPVIRLPIEFTASEARKLSGNRKFLPDVAPEHTFVLNFEAQNVGVKPTLDDDGNKVLRIRYQLDPFGKSIKTGFGGLIIDLWLNVETDKTGATVSTFSLVEDSPEADEEDAS